jgi:hypothetical protein
MAAFFHYPTMSKHHHSAATECWWHLVVIKPGTVITALKYPISLSIFLDKSQQASKKCWQSDIHT